MRLLEYINTIQKLYSRLVWSFDTIYLLCKMPFLSLSVIVIARQYESNKLGVLSLVYSYREICIFNEFILLLKYMFFFFNSPQKHCETIVKLQNMYLNHKMNLLSSILKYLSFFCIDWAILRKQILRVCRKKNCIPFNFHDLWNYSKKRIILLLVTFTSSPNDYWFLRWCSYFIF